MGFESFERSAITLNPYRGKSTMSTKQWLETKRNEDNAEGLWRIHDKLYDVINFISRHPGGQDWLKLTQGTDITELFETHHVSDKAEMLLNNFFVKTADKPRNYKFTFCEDGFYKSLKMRAADQFAVLRSKKFTESENIHSSLVASTIIALVLAAIFGSFFFSIIAGFSLALLGIASHNFLHKRDNWRMFCFNLTGFNYQEWRISHSISHHMYPNTAHDLEVINFEPFLRWIPKEKTELFKIISVVSAPFVWLVVADLTILKRVIGYFNGSSDFQLNHLITFLPPFTMYLLGTRDVFLIIKLWLVLISVSSFLINFIGTTAGHHHPQVYHEGDEIPSSMDFGIFQLNAIIERSDVKRNKFLTLTQFGHHTLHHIFPTLDHSLLPHFQELFLDTCDDFKIHLREYPWWPLIVGQFKQLERTKTISLKEMKIK